MSMNRLSLLCLTLIFIGAHFLESPAGSVKNERAVLRNRPKAPPLFYYYEGRLIRLEEVDGLRAWRFAGPGEARAARLALESAGGGTSTLAAPAPAVRTDLSSLGWLIVETGDAGKSPAGQATVRDAATVLDVQVDAPVYMSQYTSARQQPLVIPPQIVVKWKASLSASEREDLAASYGLKQSGNLLNDVWLYDVAGNEVQPAHTLGVANGLVESGAAQFAHPNFIFQVRRFERSPHSSPVDDLQAFLSYARLSDLTLQTNDTYFPDQWHLNNRGSNTIDGAGVPGADISATRAWRRIFGATGGIKVAVLDDGLDQTHEDMQGQFLQGRDYMSSPPDDDPTPDLVDSHGCATSGLIAARGDNGKGVVGVVHQTDTKIIHVRIFDRNGATSDANIGLALRWAVDQGADVLSNSWGGGSASDNITDAVNYAVTMGRGGKGAPCLFASGNDYLPLSYPAWLDNAISVGGATDQDQHVLYADFGPDLDIVAPTYDGDFGIPGIPSFERSGIWTIDNSGLKGYNSGNTSLGDAAGNYYKWFSGTSAATPIAAGVAALILQRAPDLTWQQVRARLQRTADKVPTRSSYDDSGFSPFFGHGRVNAYQALNDITPSAALSAMRSTVIFSDECADNSQGWTAETPWTLTTIGGRTVWSESPAGDYTNDLNASLISPVINLTNARGAALEVVINYDLEVTPDLGGYLTPWDFLYIEGSNDGASWTMIKLLTGETRRGASDTREYVTLRFDISRWDFTPAFRFRFRFTSDKSIVRDGVAIDRVRVLATSASHRAHFEMTGSATRPSWIRAGREVVFATADQIWSGPVATDRLQFLLRQATGETHAHLATARDRDHLYYVRQAAGLYSIERMGWDGENGAMIMAGTSTPIDGLAVSPAGNRIAWAQGGNIFLADADGAGITTLIDAAAQGIASAANPVFSSSGQRVYFDAEAEPGNRELYAVEVNGSNFRRLTTTSQISETCPDPDRHEQRLAFDTEPLNTAPHARDISMIVNLQSVLSGQPPVIAPLVTSHADDAAPRWSPQGDMLAYVRDGALWVVAALPVGGAHPELDEFYSFFGTQEEEVKEGWSTGGAQPVFPLPSFITTSNALGIDPAAFGSFGFWLSPEQMTMGAVGELHWVRFNWSSNMAACSVPQVRGRALTANLKQGNVLGVISSGGCQASPQSDPKYYDLVFTVTDGATAQPFRTAFDLLNLDPADATSGFVYLHDVEIWRFDAGQLTGGRLERSYTFDSSAEGWQTGSASPALTPPLFAHQGGALVMTATTSIDTYGFWQSSGDTTIAAGRLYAVVATLATEDRTGADKTVVRLRSFSGDNQVFTTQRITLPSQTSGGGKEIVFAVTLYFHPPQAVAGAPLHVAVDLLNFDPEAPADVMVKINEVSVFSYDAPVF
ncbi:MAG: hypothetical protein Kow0059_10300 [Candidatus Sumerlaeia bacterium]